MHEITSSEAATVLSILSKDGQTEESGTGAPGIPTSTFYVTRRKIYEAGWLSDRFVPNPWAVGVRAVDFLIARPSPTERARLETEWAYSGTNVLLWSGPNLLFGVFFRSSGHAFPLENGTAVSIASDSGSVPVYFDYSRPWSRFIRVDRETGYPRPLGEPRPHAEGKPPAGVPEMMLLDQDGGGSSSRPRAWHSPAGLSRGQQRLLDRGVLQSRTFLNLDAVPPYEGQALEEIVFLTGELRNGVSTGELLGALTTECRVSPILLACDGDRVLLLALGQVGAGASKRTRVPRAEKSVVATLDAALQGLQMNIEHVRAVQKLVDHRYYQLFSAAPGQGD